MIEALLLRLGQVLPQQLEARRLLGLHVACNVPADDRIDIIDNNQNHRPQRVVSIFDAANDRLIELWLIIDRNRSPSVIVEVLIF